MKNKTDHELIQLCNCGAEDGTQDAAFDELCSRHGFQKAAELAMPHHLRS
jgi:hypothetical protein